MGEEYLKARFETAIVNEDNNGIYEKAKNPIAKTIFKVYNDNHGLYIYGDNSSGKTHLSACIANDLMEKDIQVIFTSLGSIIRETFSNNLIYERLARVPFFVFWTIWEKSLWAGKMMLKKQSMPKQF